MRVVVFMAGCLAIVFCAINGAACAEPISDEDRKFFENKIRPVLVKHCYECHGGDSKELGGQLMLDQPSAMIQGGQSGPALIAGQPDESLIIQALRYDEIEMPPDAPLPKSVVNDFVRWVKRGAADPRKDKQVPESVSQESNKPLDPESLWSFFPRQNPSIPDVENDDWSRDPIDRFVLARLEAEELTPTDDADARSLIQRLYNDLVGLRPTYDQIQAFCDDYAFDPNGSVRELVDSLLDSPAFGERWGRHWLDVARFGESNGDDGLGRNATFPHAWRYRDYVIDAFNQDTPYDEFLIEQIAGDLLPAETAQQRNRQLTATGFLAIGWKPAAAMNKNFPMDVVDDQINVISTAVMGLSVACARCHDHKHDPIPTRDYYALAGIFTSTETLYGLSGNEKLTAPPTELHQLRSDWTKDDPKQKATKDEPTPRFPQEYVAAVANLKPLLHASLDTTPDGLHVANVTKFDKQNFASVKTANIHGKLPASGESYSIEFWFRNELDNLKRPITAYLFSRAKQGDKKLPGDHLGLGGSHDKGRAGKLFVFNGNDKKQSIAGNTVIDPKTWNHVTMVREQNRLRVFLNGRLEIDDELPATYGDSPDYCFANRSDKFAPLVGQMAHFSIYDRAIANEDALRLHDASGRPRAKAPAEFALAMGVREKGKPADCKIRINGESKEGALVPRGFPRIYDQVNAYESASWSKRFEIDSKQSGRMQLATWLTDPAHPQTARVMVNRVWMHLFGQPIVSTPDDFGVYGARPTHPGLLDHLAQRFIDDGWSIKRLIRNIVLTRTYQLSSRATEAAIAADPDNVWNARHSRRRMDAETLRDSMLQVSGWLDQRPGQGSAIESLNQLINWPPGEATNLHRQSNRRSVYLCMLRHAPPPELAAFDFPDGVGIAGRRDETTLPTQALFLLNSEFVVRQADSLATTLLLDDNASETDRVQKAFRLILSRDASEGEMRQSLDHVHTVLQSLDPMSGRSSGRMRKAWASLCQGLLATNEFRYID